LKENTKLIRKLKDVPCIDCGYRFPWYVMEFDHVPERGKKKYNISSLVYRTKLTAPYIQIELKNAI
jgi:hypothetical protein